MQAKLIDCSTLSITLLDIESLQGELLNVDIKFGYNTETLTSLDATTLLNINNCTAIVQNREDLDFQGLLTQVVISTPSGTKIFKAIDIGLTYVNLFSESHLDLFQVPFENWLKENFGEDCTHEIEELENGDLTITILNLKFGTSLDTVNLIGYTEDFELTGYTALISCSNEGLTFTPSQLEVSTEETFPHGIYSFEIVYSSDLGETVTQKFCLFIDCGELICDVANHMLKCPDSNIQCDYFILYNMQECDCACDNMLVLYNKILSIIEEDPCSYKPCNEC